MKAEDLQEIIDDIQPDADLPDKEEPEDKKPAKAEKGKKKTDLGGLSIDASDEVKGKERFEDEAIPPEAISDEPQKLVRDIIDDWQGWRINVRGGWYPIKGLHWDGGQLVSIVAGGLSDAYDKDETPVLR